MTQEQVDLDGLLQEALLLKKEWTYFSSLFLHSDERTKLLHMHMPAVWRAVQRAFINSMVMSICRLTDEGSDNLTLTTITLKYANDPRIAATQRELNGACATIRKVRNKVVGHRDLKVARGAQSLAWSTDDIRDSVMAIEILAVQLGKIIENTCIHIVDIEWKPQVDLLEATLIYGREHSKEVHELIIKHCDRTITALPA